MSRGKPKTRQEILNSPLITKTEIGRLMGVGWETADRAYRKARQIEQEELGYEPLCPTRAKTKHVLKVFGLTYEDMRIGGNENV